MATEEQRPKRTCYRHPKREATMFCRQCERPACHECVYNTHVGLKCGDCAPAKLTRRPTRAGVQIAVVVLTCIAIVAAVSKWGSDGGRSRGAAADPAPGLTGDIARFEQRMESCVADRASSLSDADIEVAMRDIARDTDLPPGYRKVTKRNRAELRMIVAQSRCAEELTG